MTHIRGDGRFPATLEAGRRYAGFGFPSIGELEDRPRFEPLRFSLFYERLFAPKPDRSSVVEYMGVTLCSFCIALVFSRTGMGAAAIRFEDFASGQALTLVGDAAVTGKTLRLTPAKGDRSGAAWYREKQPVGSGFDTTFQFQLTHQGGLGHGADGSLSFYRIPGRQHWEDAVPLGALQSRTQTLATEGKRPSHGALRYSSIHTEIRKKEILQPTTWRFVPAASPAKWAGRHRAWPSRPICRFS